MQQTTQGDIGVRNSISTHYLHETGTAWETKAKESSAFTGAQLTGTVAAARLDTATTQLESDDSTKIATTAYVVDKITTLIGGAPSTLNDLNELALAINDDADYNSTLTTALATKMPLAGGAFTGAVTTNSTFDGVDIATRDAILTSTTTTAGAALPKAGGTMTNTLTVQNNVTSNTDPSLILNSSSNLSADNYIQMGQGATSNPIAMGFDNSTNKFKIARNSSGNISSGEHLTIDSSGNVGIGTSSPDSLLEVSGADESQIKMTGTSGVEAVMRASATTATIGTNTAHKLYLRTDNSARVTIESTGNVGIGTTGPAGKLHVMSGDAGVVTPSTQADDLVVEASTKGGITIMTPDAYSARIRFTSPSTEAGDVGGADIFYRQNINKMSMGTTVAGGKLAFKSGAGTESLILDDGVVSTPTGSAISYAAGSDYKINDDSIEVIATDNSGDGETWLTMKTFVAVKSGKLRFRWDAYIQSGTYYWAGEFHKNGTLMKKSDNSTDAHHSYSQSLASGFSSSVHNYRTFEMDLGDVAAGDVITYKMASSTGGGSIQSGNGQKLYCKNFEVYSTTPSFETAAYIDNPRFTDRKARVLSTGGEPQYIGYHKRIVFINNPASSSYTTTLMKFARWWWGIGNTKITIGVTLYGGNSDYGEFLIDGHTRSGLPTIRTIFNAGISTPVAANYNAAAENCDINLSFGGYREAYCIVETYGTTHQESADSVGANNSWHLYPQFGRNSEEII